MSADWSEHPTQHKQQQLSFSAVADCLRYWLLLLVEIKRVGAAAAVTVSLRVSNPDRISTEERRGKSTMTSGFACGSEIRSRLVCWLWWEERSKTLQPFPFFPLLPFSSLLRPPWLALTMATLQNETPVLSSDPNPINCFFFSFESLIRWNWISVDDRSRPMTVDIR